MRKIILASSSPTRKRLLESTGLVFEVDPSSYEEDMTLPLSPDELVKFLSKEKAKTVIPRYEDAIVISADTIISFNNIIIGKPHTAEKAKNVLKMLSGNTHSAFTGLTVVDTKDNKIINKAIETKLIFKNVSNETIDDYIKNGNPLKYAGSYTLPDIEDTFVEKVIGSPSNVMGLPIEELMEILKEFNVVIKK